MSQAFHNDVSVRSAALARLAACTDAGRLQAGHINWTAQKCSAVGALVGSDDLATWEATLGLPAWFAYVLETAVGGMREPGQAMALATNLLNAIPVGIDMDRTGSALIVYLLQDVAASIAAAPLSVELSTVMQEIIALHLDSLAGQQVAAADWKTVRRMATNMTDNIADPLEKEVARCVESAAWDPLRSRTAVLDTLRQWLNAYRIRDAINADWGPARDAAVQKQLDDIHQRYVVNAPDPKPNVFDLYEQHHPEDAAALRAHMAKQREDQWRLAGMAGPMLLAFLNAKQGQ